MRLTRRAIVCPPAVNFAQGLTTVDLGVPDYARAIEQHDAYCSALEECGLELIRLAADERYPDSTFVEDTAVLTERCAILTRPGAPSRRGEIAAVQGLLAEFFSDLRFIHEPGTLDGGDVCEAGDHFFIGVSARTNEAGAKQLAAALTAAGYTATLLDVRGVRGILHLKSGLAYLGDNRLVVIEALQDRVEGYGYGLIGLETGDEYAANCVRLNDRVLIAAGYPALEAKLRACGHQTSVLEVSEFQKMDGGLSCLSLRF